MDVFTQEQEPWKCIKWYTFPCVQLNRTCFLNEWKEDKNEVIQKVEDLKNSIQPYDRTDVWDLAKRITNPYELIYTTSSRLLLPKSTCCLKPLSRSYFKMVEILSHLSFFDRHTKPKSLHLCEGPGGFMEAFLNLSETRKQNPSLYAMTLKSTHTMIPGWKRATTFLQKHKNIHILYGPLRTGNLYEKENQNECVEALGTGASLITCDGGFDFSEEFFAQEKSIFRLLVCCAVTSLQAISQGGDFVLKIFECHSQATRDFLAILASCFQQWTLYKPTASRPCNSEWYFLGKSALKDRSFAIETLQNVRDHIEKESITHILETNPINDTLIFLQKERMEKQMEALKKVLSFCKTSHTGEQLDEIWKLQRNACIDWCHTFEMPTTFRKVV